MKRGDLEVVSAAICVYIYVYIYARFPHHQRKNDTEDDERAFSFPPLCSPLSALRFFVFVSLPEISFPFFLFFVYKYAGEGEEGIIQVTAATAKKGFFVYVCLCRVGFKLYTVQDEQHALCTHTYIHIQHNDLTGW